MDHEIPFCKIMIQVRDGNTERTYFDEKRSATNQPSLETQMPAIPITPTVSRIIAISLAVSDPFAAHKKFSNARLTSPSVVNSLLKQRFQYIQIVKLLKKRTSRNRKISARTLALTPSGGRSSGSRIVGQR